MRYCFHAFHNVTERRDRQQKGQAFLYPLSVEIFKKFLSINENIFHERYSILTELIKICIHSIKPKMTCIYYNKMPLTVLLLSKGIELLFNFKNTFTRIRRTEMKREMFVFPAPAKNGTN